MKQRFVLLDKVEITVLDEADHMADLGFLPVVRRLMDQTPRTGQRMLFSATLDGGVDVLVKRFMNRPVTHHVDSASEAPIEMSHHVLHVRHDDRFDVLVDLTAAPGRSVVFTRTKRRAKVLTKQLITAGVPAVELHGNLAQNARSRNLGAFSDGSAETLVCTDIAARGIHVDDVALVIHADPPVEHKAYLHRSGRTARAGAVGTVITLMTDDQQADVRDLTRKAGISPTVSRVRPGDAMLAQLAPGDRTFQQMKPELLAAPQENQPRRARTGGAARPAAAHAGRSRTEGSRTAGTRAGASGQSRGGAATGGGRARGGSGSAPVHTSQSRSTTGTAGGRSAQPAAAAPRSAAAFSAGTRVGGRRTGR
jgi:superfamily II DNA/RNA helicase